ncbi:hypothetical protein CRM22_010179 [Opisthorchis felineus]|uniref:G-protein coupled receptors family 1 profile domain-containing protein n=1 Tax=Opisthorchis felineus TaxID=147828 RepID=A0A4S2L1A7_OPIFE|nr:hypothetical protein CRM22_010179 [Opisthorchis felineus]
MGCLDSEYRREEIMVYHFRGYVTPVLVLLGIVGNLLVLATFIVLQHKQKSRFNVHIMWIATFETLDLIFDALLDDFLGRGIHWISDCVIHIKLDTFSSWSCKLMSYSTLLTSFSSNTLLVLFTFDRLLTTYNPIRFRGDFFVGRLSCFLSIVIICLCVLLSPQLVHADVVMDGKTFDQSCIYPNPLHWGVQFVLWLMNCGAYIIPTCLIIILNALIIGKFKSNQRNRHRMGVTVNQTQNELPRIVGHLILTSVFLLLTLPLVIVIILRQRADRGNYVTKYPAFEKQLKDLSKLFSSFESINRASLFPICLMFLPNFQQVWTRLLYLPRESI